MTPDDSSTARLLERHRQTDARRLGDVAEPRLRTVIVTCMDCRIDPVSLFALEAGEVHVLRNAGGLVTDDIVRSVAISQAALGTREVIVVQHTACGMGGGDDEALADGIEAASGTRPALPLGSFDEVETSVRAGVEALRKAPVLAYCDCIHGFVLDLATGRLEPVAAG